MRPNEEGALSRELRVKGLSETADVLWQDMQRIQRDHVPVDSASRDGFLGLCGPAAPVPHV